MIEKQATHYRLELRQYGRILRIYETLERSTARETALQWLHDTTNAVVVLFVDGMEVKQPKIPKALGCKGGEMFDPLDRYFAICRKTKTASIYRDHQGNQYIGNGQALYLVNDLPELDEESLLAIFDVPGKEREDWDVDYQTLPEELDCADNTKEEQLLQPWDLKVESGGTKLQPLTCSQGLAFLDHGYLKPPAGRTRLHHADRALHARRQADHRGQGGAPAPGPDPAGSQHDSGLCP